MYIAVNEIFSSFQGEGRQRGKPVSFIRLSGCNLACQWCDTPYTWNWIGTKFLHPEKYDKKKEVRKMLPEEILLELEFLKSPKAVVVSGGEPFLQWKKFYSLFRLLKKNGYWIEVETNGTILPDSDLLDMIDQINCSPKLSNSGSDNSFEMRIVPGTLNAFAQRKNIDFKFVITSDDDTIELLKLICIYKINGDNVFLMPEGRSKEEQEDRTADVKYLCEQFGFNFTPRLQVLKYGTKRGV